MRTTPKVLQPVIIKVWGIPAPQGSKRHVGRGIMIESSKKVKPWREAVKHAALAVLPDGHQPFTGSVTIDVAFFLPRPQGHYGTGRNAGQLRPSAPTLPAVRPDLDKLVRSTLDALGDAWVFTDDARITTILAVKEYADTEHPPGAYIQIQEVG